MVLTVDIKLIDKDGKGISGKKLLVHWVYGTCPYEGVTDGSGFMDAGEVGGTITAIDLIPDDGGDPIPLLEWGDTIRCADGEIIRIIYIE